MGTKALWAAFGTSWIIILGYGVGLAVWCVNEHSRLREQMLTIDRAQAIQMARVETELKQISATLVEIKHQMSVNAKWEVIPMN